MSVHHKSGNESSAVFYADPLIDCPNPEKLKNKLFALKKRFNLNISLVLNSTHELKGFDLHRLRENYGVSDVHVTGDAAYTFSDAVAVAMRAKTANSYLCSLHFLNDRFNDVVRFVFDTERTTNTITDIDSTGEMHWLSVAKLRSLNFDYVGQSSSWFYSCLYQAQSGGAVTEGLLDKLSIAPESVRKQAFISEYAVRRMFGLDKLRQSNLLFDGLALNSYAEVCIVGPKKISSLDAGKKSEVTLVQETPHEIDIYPAPSVKYASESPPKSLSIPRTILRISMVDGLKSSNHPEEARVGYIMSNYNKSRYITASIFSILSQFHENITLFFWDDVSTDDSQSVMESLLKCIDLSKVNVIWNFGTVNRGTYWIRNDIIYQSKKDIDYYFINDSDDYSSARRTEFQLQRLNADPAVEVAMVDIVRTDGNYKLLSMNNEIERYGTATTAFRSSLIDKIGYFQVFRKNTDTEFIERVKTFIGESAVARDHYPGLYQTFDGSNLTSDIYTISDGNSTIEVSTGLRGVHDLLWRKHHSRLKLENLPAHFSFPESTIPGEFKRLDRSFFVQGYDAFDSVCVYLARPDEIPSEIREQMKKGGYLIISSTQQGDLVFEKNGQENFTTDLDFPHALSAYLGVASFQGYIISQNFLPKFTDFKRSAGSLLKSSLREFVHKSKSTGDSTVYDLSGSILPSSIFGSGMFPQFGFFASYVALANMD